jgi:hypothetical protein
VQFFGSLGAGSGLRDLVTAGARWVRVPVVWATVEPTDTTPANYDWTAVDETVSNAAHGYVNLVLTISGQPSWAAEYPMGPPYDPADLVEFVAALSERYDGDGVDDIPGSYRVRYLELYNEPDNCDTVNAASGGWGYWGHNGAGYAALLQQVYAAVKAVSPETDLVLGGLALDWFEEQGGIFDDEFLDDVLAACQGHDCFDAVNFHYYPFFITTWEPYGPGIIGKTAYVRQRMAAYGFDLPVICTETSWAGRVFTTASSSWPLPRPIRRWTASRSPCASGTIWISATIISWRWTWGIRTVR